ncbi:hypothetical protein CRE_14229 [Caenorhabditis remanei]|uniref:Uncharacterized protein n=1 Tax=Caenorhabditis remanei TaxID=31234 RepID=E3N1L4_CAERE|nr:hypothetical protein CRE_14229 [Caenorhabditis remanei]
MKPPGMYTAVIRSWETSKQVENHEYPITVNPFVPEILNNTDHRKLITSGNEAVLSFVYAPEGSKLVTETSLEMIRGVCLSWFKNDTSIQKEFESPLPRNLIAVSMSEKNFNVGGYCQEFSPSGELEIPDNDSFNYQKLSQNVQATYYTEGGVRYLAGICYYPVINGKYEDLLNDQAVIVEADMKAEPYPLQNREVSSNMIDNKKYGRDCKTAGKRVVVECSGENDTIRRHWEWDINSRMYVSTKCEECLIDGFTYKWID